MFSHKSPPLLEIPTSRSFLQLDIIQPEVFHQIATDFFELLDRVSGILELLDVEAEVLRLEEFEVLGLE